MYTYDSFLHEKGEALLKVLSKRNTALFKKVGFLAYEAKNRCCYSKITNMGWDLGRYGYKPIKRTQSYEAFSELSKLELFVADRANMRSPYRTVLLPFGQYVYCMLVNKIKGKPTLEIEKTDTRTEQKPTLLDQDQDLERSIPEAHHCNYTNTGDKFSDKVTQLLDSTTPEIRALILQEFKTCENKPDIRNRERYMETIAKRVIFDQAEIEKLARMDRERSLRMQAETKRRIAEQDSVVQYTAEQKKAMTAGIREALYGQQTIR